MNYIILVAQVAQTEGLIFSGLVRMRQFNNLGFLYLGYEPEGREFESLRARSTLLDSPIKY